MPTYEYECHSCDKRFEVFQKMSDAPLKKCPECKGKVRRLIGLGAGVIYKGAGFYTTEYRSEDYKKRASEEKGGGTTPSPSHPHSHSHDSKSSCSSCKSSKCSTCK